MEISGLSVEPDICSGWNVLNERILSLHVFSSSEAEHVEFKFYDLMEEILNKYPSSKKAAVQDFIPDSHSEKGGMFTHNNSILFNSM